MEKSCGGRVGASPRNSKADLLWLLTVREADIALQGQQAVWGVLWQWDVGLRDRGNVARGGWGVVLMGLGKLWGTGTFPGATQEPAQLQG